VPRQRRALLSALTAFLALPAAAAAAPPASCPSHGGPTAGNLHRQAITGTFGQEHRRSHVMVPFRVPSSIRGRRVTQVRVRYCWDRPEGAATQGHTLDLGIYEPRRRGRRTWGVPEFRGWGGSSHPDVAITRQGFSPECEYVARPKGYVPGRTTRGYVPGPLPAGTWAVELGVGAVLPPPDDATGEVGWRVEIELSNAKAYGAVPYRRARVARGVARRGPGWYAGDLHVHAEHSALGDAPMRRVFDSRSARRSSTSCR
jgi:hypothetical protein